MPFYWPIYIFIYFFSFCQYFNITDTTEKETLIFPSKSEIFYPIPINLSWWLPNIYLKSFYQNIYIHVHVVKLFLFMQHSFSFHDSSILALSFTKFPLWSISRRLHIKEHDTGNIALKSLQKMLNTWHAYKSYYN